MHYTKDEARSWAAERMPLLSRKAPKRMSRNETTKEGRKHSFWYLLVSTSCKAHFAVQFRILITALIIIDVIAFVLQSDELLSRKYAHQFLAIEALSSIVFMLEYIVRIVTVPEKSAYRGLAANQARAAWFFSWDSLVDLLAFLPWFIEILTSLACCFLHRGRGVSLPNLLWLRLLRLARLLKSWRVIEAFDIVARVIYFNAEILLSALLICGVMLIITSTLLFLLRPEHDTEDDFSSVFATMYLAVMMLTGQGQPSGVLPWYTKVMCCITSVFAVAQFAIPASMLTWGFEQEAERRMKKAAEKREILAKKALRGETIDEDAYVSSDDELREAWQEYEEVVVGSEDEHETGILTISELGRATSVFSALDIDESGHIQKHELRLISGRHGAEALANKMDKDASGYVTSVEFLTWLSNMKGHVDSRVFETVLLDLELAGRRGQHLPHQASVVSTVPTQPSNAIADQLVAFAQQYRDLEAEVVMLKDKLQQRDAEIERLRAGQS